MNYKLLITTVLVVFFVTYVHVDEKEDFDFKLQAFSIVESPDGGPEWSLQFAVKFLFPK